MFIGMMNIRPKNWGLRGGKLAASHVGWWWCKLAPGVIFWSIGHKSDQFCGLTLSPMCYDLPQICPRSGGAWTVVGPISGGLS
eukprot:99579-Rhodomonas_salina.1